ncbi:hypothetical protein [Luteolibacter soli]|uniref:Uncharacterized protein n=1 Tax=Luteolibacter soli TaxID=3135280 RepID=A0ABU9B3J7_9BACT
MNDALNAFIELYRGALFSHSDVIFDGLERGTVRLVRISNDVPSGLYAELFGHRASLLEALDPCPDPESRDEWRVIADHLAKAHESEVCRTWTFIGERYAYTVYEIEQSSVIAGCEVDDLAAREEQRAKIAAIGVTFSSNTVRKIGEVLVDPRFGFGAEGTRASGYELYTAKEAAREAIELLRNCGILDAHEIEIYNPTRGANDGTRYDRLLAHLEGEDSNRPSYSGVRFSL